MSDVSELDSRMLSTFAAYGLFMINWARFETLIETAIQKRCGLHPVEGTIITAGLMFERRASILRALISIDNKPAEAIALINEITREAKRNNIIHGVPFTDYRDRIIFVKRSVDQTLKATKQEFDSASMLAHAAALQKRVQRLQLLLGVTEAEVQEFANIGQILAISSATSPKPPSSTTSS